MSGYDLSKEEWDQCTEVADGVWSMCLKHYPQGSAGFPLLNNRGWLFRIKGKNGAKDFLFMFGLPAGTPKVVADSTSYPITSVGGIALVRQKEKELGLRLECIMSSGDWHHLSIKEWLLEFPTTKFYHSGVKFPSTENGKYVLNSPAHKDQMVLFDSDKPPQELMDKVGDVLDFVCLNQGVIYTEDPTVMSTSGNYEAGKHDFFSAVGMLENAKYDQRFLAVHSYHKATKTLCVDHSFDVTLDEQQIEDLKKRAGFPASFLIGALMTPMNFRSALTEVGPGVPPFDEKVHLEQVQMLYKLDVRCIVDQHMWPKVRLATLATKGEYIDCLHKAYEKSGEWDPTGNSMWYKQVKKGMCC